MKEEIIYMETLVEEFLKENDLVNVLQDKIYLVIMGQLIVLNKRLRKTNQVPIISIWIDRISDGKSVNYKNTKFRLTIAFRNGGFDLFGEPNFSKEIDLIFSKNVDFADVKQGLLKFFKREFDR